MSIGGYSDTQGLPGWASGDMSDNTVSVLIITYKDLDASGQAGSTRRPLEMIEAFRSIGCSVKVLSGLQNQIWERTKRVNRILRYIEEGGSIDFCYIEPPSGPLLCPADVYLIQRISSQGVPVALFYRDAYWLMSDLFGAGSRVKDWIIRLLSKRDLRLFRNSCQVMYYPSDGLRRLVDGEARRLKRCKMCREMLLPPGCVIPHSEKLGNPALESVPTAIYVGAANNRYGAPTILASMRAINEQRIRCNLIFVCPRDQWDGLDEEYSSCCDEDWFSLVHTSDSSELCSLYDKSDFALMAYERSPYNDIAAPIKLFEYISYLKPILSTDCTFSAEFILKNNIGIVVSDSIEQYTAGLEEMCKRFREDGFRSALLRTRESNTWQRRARKVCSDLGFALPLSLSYVLG